QRVKLSRHLEPTLLRKLAFQSQLKVATEPVDLRPGVSVNFETSTGDKLTTSDAFVKAVLAILAESTSQVWGYQELLAEARLRGGLAMGDAAQAARDEATLTSNLFKLYLKGILDVWSEPVRSAIVASDKPLASPLARYQALNSTYITNRVQNALPADAFVRNVIALCDGNRTKREI